MKVRKLAKRPRWRVRERYDSLVGDMVCLHWCAHFYYVKPDNWVWPFVPQRRVRNKYLLTVRK